eukprot:752239-Pleurochrysis_carterae.AAC.1
MCAKTIADARAGTTAAAALAVGRRHPASETPSKQGWSQHLTYILYHMDVVICIACKASSSSAMIAVRRSAVCR